MANTENNITKIFINGDELEAISRNNPDKLVGVNVNRIYILITKYDDDPSKSDTVEFLKNNLNELYSISKKSFQSYTKMKVEDILIHWGKSLKSMPRSTFINISSK